MHSLIVDFRKLFAVRASKWCDHSIIKLHERANIYFSTIERIE